MPLYYILDSPPVSERSYNFGFDVKKVQEKKDPLEETLLQLLGSCLRGNLCKNENSDNMVKFYKSYIENWNKVIKPL